MTNITPLHVAAGRSPDAATKKRRGKSATTYATKASFQRLMEMTRASGLDPRSVCFGPDGTVSFSEAAPPLADPFDEFKQWEARR